MALGLCRSGQHPRTERTQVILEGRSSRSQRLPASRAENPEPAIPSWRGSSPLTSSHAHSSWSDPCWFLTAAYSHLPPHQPLLSSFTSKRLFSVPQWVGGAGTSPEFPCCLVQVVKRQRELSRCDGGACPPRPFPQHLSPSIPTALPVLPLALVPTGSSHHLSSSYLGANGLPV